MYCNVIILCYLFVFRHGELFPSPAHMMPPPLQSVPRPAHSSPLHQSLDVDFSQQSPGPSGMPFITSPPANHGASLLVSTSGSSSIGGSESQLVPGMGHGRTSDLNQSTPAVNYPLSPAMPLPPGSLFQVPQSQDILAHDATQDISTGLSQSGECYLL